MNPPTTLPAITPAFDRRDASTVFEGVSPIKPVLFVGNVGPTSEELLAVSDDLVCDMVGFGGKSLN